MYTTHIFHIFHQKLNPIDGYGTYHNVLYNVWSGLDPLMDPLNNGMSPADLVCKCYVSTLPNVNMSVLMHSRVCMYKQLVLYSFETFNRVRKIDLSLEIG